MPSILITAGDPSGDHQAARLITALRARRPDLEFWGPAGPACEQAGARVTANLARLSAIGAFDVLPHLPEARRILLDTQQQATAAPPDLAVLVDCGAFNLRLAPHLKALGVPRLGYFPPGSWSGSLRRAEAVAQAYSAVATPFPQALDAYAKLGLPATLVGHPLVDELADLAAARREVPLDPPVIALLPGSRGHEIRQMLRPMLEAARILRAAWPHLRAVVSRAPTAPAKLFDQLLAEAGLEVEVVAGSRAAMAQATAGLIKSGTVTLEAALLGLPHVCLYRVSLLAYVVAWTYVWPKPEFWAMPNVLLGRMAVPQRFQFKVTGPELARTLAPLLTDSPERRQQAADLAEAVERLGGPGATERAADVVLAMLDGA